MPWRRPPPGLAAVTGGPGRTRRVAAWRGTGRSRRVAARRGTGNMAAQSGYARTRQATAQVGDEKEVVMRAESGYGSSRPGRARGAGAPAAPRPGRHDLDPAKLEALLEPNV